MSFRRLTKETSCLFNTSMTDAEVIDLLGRDEIKKATKAGDASLKKWRQRGIPWSQRPRVAALAERLGKQLPPKFLLEQVAA